MGAMEIELLVIPGCPNADAAFDLIRTAVADIRVRATVTRTLIADEQLARQRGFVGSPTFLLDGSDPFPGPEASVALACRLYATRDGLQGLPGLSDLRQALKRAAAD